MKLLLVTRGSQGDVYPFLRLAAELKTRGHCVTLSLPCLFEKQAKDSGVTYVLQASDDIKGMVEVTPDTKNLLEWTRRVIDSQFKELIPLMAEHDILISTNTEFAAPSIAEYCKKPCIRTAYGPFIPGRTIPPPVFPWPKPHPIFTPAFLWALLNNGLNLMAKKSLNKNRKTLGMPPIKCQAQHAPANSDNFLMYSRYLGNVDDNWNYNWDIGGYCFNDELPYNKEDLEEVISFIKKDNRPTIYFSLGSCNAAQRDRFAGLLFDICTEQNYKLLLSAGWWNAGSQLKNRDNFFRMDKVIPHYLIFPHCDAIIHHGGVGTTHSAARSGRPQMITPIILDQFYWGDRIKKLGLGPGSVKIRGVSKKQLEKKIQDLVTNSSYKEKALSMKNLINDEGGLENLCRYIESYQDKIN
ncbi:MAG: glycosyltransferase [Treponema sp.]|nr:glycosyltransferase [Treponema sp.]